MAELKNIIRIAKADYDTLVADGSITKSGTTYTYSPTTTLYIVEDGLDDTYVSLGGGGGKLLSDFATTATTTDLSNSISNETTARKNADNTINTTLANKADKSHTHSYLPLSGGIETGVIKSTFTSSTWINGVSNAALTLNNTGYSAAISMPTKNGRVSISSYANGDDKVYLGYASLTQISTGTNAFTNQLYWDASTNNLVGKTFQSTATTGTAPLTIYSTTKVSNLNTDLLDGYHASGLLTALSNDNSGLSLTIGGATKSLTNLTASTCSGNAGSATKLQNVRNINGTAFNGTSDITTAKWGNSRTIKGGVLDQLSFSTDGSADATITESTYGCYINSGNKANYPYHRIASIGPLTGSWLDNSAILLISQNYAGGNYGIVKIDVRTNYSAQTSTASAKWLIRQGFDSNQIIIGLNNVYGNTYADIFFYAKTTTYLRTYVKVLHAGSGISYKRTFDLYNSSEDDSTTTTDSGKSVYCYSSISTAATALRSKAYTTIVSATTEGIAGSAESATTAGKAASADQLTNARNIQTNLESTSSAAFNGTTGITPGVTGTLRVSNGGTGKNTLTTGAALIGNGTSAVTLRSITNNTSTNNLGWTSDIGTNLTTLNTIAYWDGAYNSTTSNLKYSTNGEIIGSNNISSQSVKYATTAGSANAVAWGNVTGKPSAFTPASHTHKIKINGSEKTIAASTGSAVDLGTYAVSNTLTNENLNNVTTPGFYNAGGGNTCTNKPSGVEHFGLTVIHNASGSYYTQILTNDTKVYGRTCINGTWNSWVELKYTDTHCGYCNTASATAAKVVYYPNYVARTDNVFVLTLANANTYAGQITLNVNSTGAKNVVLNGGTMSSSLYSIPAGNYLVYYDGTNYHINNNSTIPITVTSANSASKVTSSLSWSGYNTGSYDGSSAKTITIPSNTNQLTNGAGFTTNKGTVTSVAVKMNGATKGTITSSGTIDLGTVLTAHQSLSNYLTKTDAANTYISKDGGTITGDLTITTNPVDQNGGTLSTNFLDVVDTITAVAVETNSIQADTFYLPTTSGGSTYGAGTNGQVLKSNGSTVYWANDNNTVYTLPSATSSTLGGVKIGSNITVSSGTISLTKANVTSALGYTPPTTNTTYSVATTSTNGLMSTTDRATFNNLQGKTYFDRQFTASVSYQPLFQVTLGTISLGGKNPSCPGIIEFEIEVLGSTYINATYRGVLYVPASTSVTPTITWFVKSKQSTVYGNVLKALLYDRTNNRLLFQVDSSSAYLTAMYTKTIIYRADHCTVAAATATTVGSSVTSFSL